MNILFSSQCSGLALKETRRILDHFAERKGDRYWHTALTEEGLQTIYRNLRRTARRNTAVACFQVKGKNQIDLLWIIGDASRFNAQGSVPTNWTSQDKLRLDDEHDWRYGEVIRLLANMAALFHDFGKASHLFQQKLKRSARGADPYRHEWVSLRLFAALVADAADDRTWLELLTRKKDLSARIKKNLVRDGLDSASSALKNMPPLAQAIAWLILSHHRLPEPEDRFPALDQLARYIKAEWGYAHSGQQKIKANWQFKILPSRSQHWRQRIARLAQTMLNHPPLWEQHWLNQPLVIHLARLSLMLADHYYSSQPSHERYGDADFKLHANTDHSGQMKQRLDEHLIGVAVNSSRIAWQLPQLRRRLPRLGYHRRFYQRNTKTRFQWQDHAFDLARSLKEKASKQGFFGINMASTGRGKTLANARILYGIAENGARFNIALGLRVLTLQTGEAYRQKLRLGPEDLAVLVGGQASKILYEHYSQVNGSESSESLLWPQDHVHFEGSLQDGALKYWLRGQQQALLNASILVCTVDHLIPATEGVRGGRHILPSLRLLSSDLVLDEIDDFDLHDLPALSRLVYWSGLLGSRVLISSATLPPPLVQGLFQAYQAGRQWYQQHLGLRPEPICCAWFDEFKVQSSDHADPLDFAQAHQQFIAQRVQKLRQEAPKRIGQIQSLPCSANQPLEQIIAELAPALIEQMQNLHQQHGQDRNQKRISIGLVRLANIRPLQQLAQSLLSQPLPADLRIHLCVYHSQFPLLQRAHIEKELDQILNRQQPEAIWQQPSIAQALHRFAEKNHIFVVLASPVAEVGRDHDYDWAIVEPSSMRSIIQLAGRVRRHRPQAVSQPNILIWQYNLRALRGKTIVFRQPGYENKDFKLSSHDLFHILPLEQIQPINAIARIQMPKKLQAQQRLADLEQAVLQDLMLGSANKAIPVHRFWQGQAHLSAYLQNQQKFRKSDKQDSFFLGLDEWQEELQWYRLSREGKPLAANQQFQSLNLSIQPQWSLWLHQNYAERLQQLADELDLELEDCAYRFGRIELRPQDRPYHYHPALGVSR